MSRSTSALRKFFDECSISMEVEVMNHFKEMGVKFIDLLLTKVERETAHEYLRQSEILYLKVLENIISLKRPNSAPFSGKINHTVYNYLSNKYCILFIESFKQNMQHRVLITCCMEIVLFSNNSELAFPWILDIFCIQPTDLLRIIWIINQFDTNLFSHDVVKHLNHIMEQILESIAWRKDSTLWLYLQNEPIPSCEMVFLPSHQPIVTGGPITPPEEAVRGEKSKSSKFLDRFFTEVHYFLSK